MIYKLTKKFPPEERFGLTNQMRRSAYSISTNIAEGNGRKTAKDRSHFLSIATGSVEELHYQCILARDLGYLTKEECEELHDCIQRTGYLIYKLQRSL
jgi:four helix bundle protein